METSDQIVRELKNFPKEFIEGFDVEKLIPYDNNPKIHLKESVDIIKEAIIDCGNNQPIEVDENNVILCGHGRRLALIELGIKTTDIIRYHGMTDKDKKRYRVWANKTGEKSPWDTLKLGMDFNADELKTLGFDYFKDKEQPDAVNGAFPIDIDINRERSFILISIENETDFIHLQQKFKLREVINPKSRKVGVARVITYEQLKEHLK